MDKEIRDAIRMKKNNVIGFNINKSIITLAHYGIIGGVNGINRVEFTIKGVKYNYSPKNNRVYIKRDNLGKTIIQLFNELGIKKINIKDEPVFTFGKYEKLPIRYVMKKDQGYIDWIKQTKSLDGNIINTQFIIDRIEKYG